MSGTISDSNVTEFKTITAPSSSTLLSNQPSSLNAGTYRYSAISLTGSNTLTINGNVTLYLTSTATSFSNSGSGHVILSSGASLTIYTAGNMSISGNGIMNSGIPEKLQIYGLPTCTSISMTGNGSTTGVVYAPSAGVNISGNATVYGAVVANVVTLNGSSNAALHYDENLANGPSDGLQLRWLRQV